MGVTDGICLLNSRVGTCSPLIDREKSKNNYSGGVNRHFRANVAVKVSSVNCKPPLITSM